MITYRIDSISAERCRITIITTNTMNSEGMRTESKDLETMLGDPKKAIRKMAVPLIISFAVVQINSFADTSWCSGLGSDATAGMTTISPLYWIVSGLGAGIGVGASTMIARFLARNESTNANQTAAYALILSIIISILLTPVLILSINPMMKIMGASDVASYGYDYMLPMISFTVFIMMEEVISGLLRSEGAARKSMAMSMTAAVVNMVLDPILIYSLDMGVAGAGLATAISSVISCTIGIQWYLRKRMTVAISTKGTMGGRSICRSIMGVGIPRATESVVVNGMSMVERYFVIICAGSFGSALFSIPWRFVTISCIISMALAAAVVPICSAALGRNDIEKARTAFLYGTKLCCGIIVAMTLFMFVFAELCVAPFTFSDSMIVHRGEFADVLRLYCLFIPFVGLIDMGSALLQSLRMANISMWSSLLRNILIVILFAATCHTTLMIMFAGMAVAEILGGIMMVWLATYGFRKKTGQPIMMRTS